MNINEVHWNFSHNGTKEPVKPFFESSITFEPFGIFWCGFHCCAQETELLSFLHISLSTFGSV